MNTMRPERWHAVERLYHAALVQPELERAAFLDSACAHDDTLRAEIESLLPQPNRDRVPPQPMADVNGSAMVGRRIGAYEILELLGAGGMGEVYRARDTRLGRDVAIKVLPEALTHVPDRLARFEREARLLATLNHPNIAAIYGLEEHAGTSALVLELVEGPTLAERLASGRMDVREALGIAIQIAGALEAAHDKDILHRDLKPANIKLTRDGKVKVLDFGLAKALADSDLAADPTNSPTATMVNTRAGIVLGTAAYMSPEQAAGKAVGKRSDVWSFGVVLYEMLTGHNPFGGRSVSHIIVNVTEQEPDWTKLPPLPASARDSVEDCLRKDPTLRPRDIADIRLRLERALTTPIRPPTSTPLKSSALRPWLWPSSAVGVVVIAAFAGFLFMQPVPASDPDAVRFEITAPRGTNFTGVNSLSPDGRTLAFTTMNADQRTRAWVRTLDTLESRPLEGTDGVNGLLFWSWDSRSVVFNASARLQKVDVSGGPAQLITNVPDGQLGGGFWTRDNVIVFAIFGSVPHSLFRVSSAGGTALPLTTLDKQQSVHYSPELLPDGRHFLYAANASDPAAAGIFVSSLDAKPGDRARRVLPDPSRVVFAASPNRRLGYLLFIRRPASQALGTLMAQPLDSSRLEPTGEAVPIAEGVPGAAFSTSASGAIVYKTGPESAPGLLGAEAPALLTWFDRQGKVLGTVGERDSYGAGVMLSPDNTRLAVSRTRDIWIVELARGVSHRLTFDAARDRSPVWFPDSSRIAFMSDRDGMQGIYQVAASQPGQEQLLLKTTLALAPTAFSRDGRFLLAYTTFGGAAPNDIWLISLEESPSARRALPLVQTPFNERGVRLSPDGRFFSYTSNETGQDEAYVRRFDGDSPSVNSGQVLVSKNGGTSPKWRADGKEMFYQTLDGAMVSVDITTTPEFRVRSKPKPLFKPSMRTTYWDVTSDGQRFMIPVSSESVGEPYKVILNWTATLRRRSP